MGTPLEEKEAVWGRVENHVGSRLRIMRLRRPDCRVDAQNELLVFMTFSKPDQLFYDLNDSDLDEWSDYNHAFVVFVLGRADDVLIVPIREIASRLRSGHHKAQGNNYKLHVEAASDGRIRFRELSRWELASFRNAYSQYESLSAASSGAEHNSKPTPQSLTRDQEEATEALEKGVTLVENQLEEYLLTHLDTIEPGLTLYSEPSGRNGRQYHTPIGRIDLLCRRRDGGFLVIELKATNRSDAVVGQISRYVGWVKEHLAGKAPVKGLILVPSSDPLLKYAVSGNPDLELKCFRLRLEILSEDL